MDFTFTETQNDVTELAAGVLARECTPERLRAVDATGTGRFDRELWATMGTSGLLGLTAPEANGGAGLGVLEACSALVEAGRRLAPVPLGPHLMTSLAMARYGSAALSGAWLSRAADGSALLTAAVAEELDAAPARPAVTAVREADSWTLTGTKVVVPAGTVADLVAVTATAGNQTVVALVQPTADGVTVTPQRLSDGNEVARLEFAGTQVPAEHVLDAPEAAHWLVEALTLATCAHQLGVVSGALDLTAAYSKTREQFGRAIGSFQAVAQRLADGYIDVLGVELTLWQAAWRLAEGLPAATEIASAKVWAADAGHRIAHTTVHVHGGVGIDLDGEAHRYFTGAKMGEFHLGGATEQALRIGALFASDAG